ncbi:MAG: hypothetical protein IJF02_05255 [Oscillospiraceae bacterium]|nr:hypothetical protein [Oscillospiraceae bacterium]
MNNTVFHFSGSTAALRHAEQYLSDRGYTISAEPTHAVTHLLLPVPSFDPGGIIKGGGLLEDTLKLLPEDVTVIGGNLQNSALSAKNCIDLLQDTLYLAQNAAITADCAIRIAGNNLPVVFNGCPILVIGWGRIGKCLACKLKAMGADVTVAARKETDRGVALSLGFHVRDTAKLNFGLSHYRVIYNTVPSLVLDAAQTALCRSDCIKIDLASKQGIFDDTVIWARGLPNRDAPESSGILIARSVLRILSGKEDLS